MKLDRSVDFTLIGKSTRLLSGRGSLYSLRALGVRERIRPVFPGEDGE